MRMTMIAIAALITACDGANPGDGSSTPDMAQNQGDGGGCKSDNVACGGGCVNLQTDPSNCGTCGHKCGTNDTCVSGKCQPGAVPDMSQPADMSQLPDMTQAAGCSAFTDLADDLPQGLTVAPFQCMTMAIDKSCWSIGGQPTIVHLAGNANCTALGFNPAGTHTPSGYSVCGAAHDCFQDCGDQKKTCYVTHYSKSWYECDTLEVRMFQPGVWSPTSTDYAVISTGDCTN